MSESDESQSNREETTTTPPYHHFKMPRKVLSKRQRSSRPSTISVNNSGQQTHGNDNCSATTQDAFNIFVDETDKTTHDINRKLRKKRKKNPHGSLSSPSTTSNCFKENINIDEKEGSPQSGHSDDTNNDSLKVYAFEKPLMNNNTNFKDNYFILTPVAPSPVCNADSSSSGALGSSSSCKSITSHSSQHLQQQTKSSHPKKKAAGHIKEQFSPRSSYSSSSSSSLTPTLHNVQNLKSSTQQSSHQQDFVQPPLNLTQGEIGACNLSFQNNNLGSSVSEPIGTLFHEGSSEMHQQLSSQSNSPFQRPQLDNLSLQLFSQILEILIQRYQHQLDEILKSPDNLILRLLRELYPSTIIPTSTAQQQQMAQNTLSSSEMSSSTNNQSTNSLQLSMDDLLSFQEKTESDQNPFQLLQSAPQFSQQVNNTISQPNNETNNSTATIEEILSFILQNHLFNNNQ